MKTGKILASAAALLLSGVAMTAVANAKNTAATAAEPVLLREWTGPYDGVPAWDKVRVAEFPAAFQAAMNDSRAEFEAMIEVAAPITFENTITASELSGVSRCTAGGGAARMSGSARTGPESRETAKTSTGSAMFFNFCCYSSKCK